MNFMKTELDSQRTLLGAARSQCFGDVIVCARPGDDSHGKTDDLINALKCKLLEIYF